MAMLRYLDPSEHYFWLLDQVSSMNFAVIAEFDQPVNVSNIQTALKQLQKQQAIFGLTVNQDTQGRLFLQQHQQDIFLESVEGHQWQNVIAKALAQRFEPGQPLIRAFFLQSEPDSSQTSHSSIALLFNHAIADGRTGMTLLTQWLDLTLDRMPGHCEAAPIQALHQKLPPGLNLINQPDKLAQHLEQKKAEIRRFGRPDALPELTAQESPATGEISAPRIISLALSQEQSQSLKQLCQQKQVRIHSALMAAQLMAIYQNSKQETATLSLTSPVDMRRYFENRQPELGMHTAMLSSVYQLSSDSDFWSLARQADEELHQQLKRDDPAFYYQLIRPEQIPCTEAALEMFTESVLKSAPQTLISNLGVIPEIADSKVKRMSFALCPMPFQSLFTAVTHYQGKLNLNITYDSSRLDSEEAHSVAQRILQQLKQLPE
ncbi:phthiocerol/phthiodiolone dimycocerosyl transferase family protein [Oceanospirillum sediminis]|uniref:Phthiocerol/phthiodiolone dimycocerosyl transferase n=1 Tax=Oceanospirillum sediminis TaxID=2760088 RepID=A0A839IY79_9GAMM|nr:condensation domain-containing protein [Oceanospirillum sediminis]MBB1489544.1 hypothetical protein [Oceanospirillum sediminis]